MSMDKAWLIEFATYDRQDCHIVIHAETKEKAKPFLKNYMAGKPYRIKRITEWSVADELPKA